MGYRKLVLTAVGAIAGVALSTGSAIAAEGMFPLGNGNMANGQEIYTKGKGSAPPCMSCHGQDGLGIEAVGAPRLAGQFFSFLYKQLEDFANRERTPSGAGAVMNAFASALSEQDRIDVATYLANNFPQDLRVFSREDLIALEESGTEVGDIARGRQIVEFGSPERDDGYPKDLGSQGPGVAACKSCHGVAGRGAPPVYPMIGQQRYGYLVGQLKNWRDESRANDPMGQMRVIAKKLSDQDIRDVAAYLMIADPYFTTGSNRTPYDHAIEIARERMANIGADGH